MVVYAISFFLMQALSRYREFAADRGAAIITGRPSALASALMKIGGDDAARAHSRTCAPRRDERVLHLPGRARSSRVFNLFSTHPPMEKRIAALARLEAQLQGTAGRAIPVTA